MTYAVNPESKPGITVVAYCRGGNHRSVAFSQLLTGVLQRQKMILCPETEVLFLTQMGGFWNQVRCNRCNLCRHEHLSERFQGYVSEAFQLAQDAWETSPDEI